MTTDIFLFGGEPNPNDIRLRVPAHFFVADTDAFFLKLKDFSDGEAVTLVEAVGVGLPTVTQEALAVTEAWAVLANSLGSELASTADAALLTVATLGAEIAGLAEGASSMVPAAVGDALVVGEAEVAQQQSVGQVTDTDTVAFAETVIEPIPPIIVAAPPIFGGGLGRKRTLEKPPRRLQRRPIAREWVTLEESAIAELQEPFGRKFGIPWTPESDDEEALVLMALMIE